MKISMIPNKIVKLIHASKGDTSLRKWSFEPYDNNGAISVSDIKDQLVYKTENGGTEQLLPVNSASPVTSPFVGTIRYDTDTDVDFFYKQSDFSGQARIKSIKGNTLVYDQLITNGNFADGTTGWQKAKGDITASDNVLTYSVTSVGTSSTQNYIRANCNIIAGHRYYMSFDIKVSKANTRITVSRQTASDYIFSTFDVTTADEWVSKYTINTIANNGTYIDIRYSNVATIGEIGDTISLRNVVFFDITANESITTRQQFREMFPLPYYNTGTYLLNFNGTAIKTVGKNLFSGIIYSDNHAINSSGDFYSSSNFKIYTVTLPVGNYIITATNNGSSSEQALRVMSVDGNLTSLDFQSVSIASDNRKSVTFTVPVGTVQTLVSAYNNFGDIMLESGSIATNYEPYKTSTTLLPILADFPTGMRSAVDVYDERTETDRILRVIPVDLGKLTWTLKSGDTSEFDFFESNALGVGKGTLNVVCPKYKTVSEIGAAVGEDKAIRISNNSTVRIRDLSYTDAQTFTAAMSGVYMNSEIISPLVNYEMVDMGSLTWTSNVNYGMNTDGLIGKVKTPSSNNNIANIYCPIRITTSYSTMYNSGQNGNYIGVSVGGYVRLNTTETDPVAFAQSVSGIYLMYEPVEDTGGIHTASLVTKNIDTPCYLYDGKLTCDCTDLLSNEAGFFDAKLKLKDANGVAYSSKFKLHVEDL